MTSSLSGKITGSYEITQHIGFEWCLPPFGFSEDPDRHQCVVVNSTGGPLVLTRVENVSDGHGDRYVRRTTMRHGDLNTADK